jgi:hypothetical protein
MNHVLFCKKEPKNFCSFGFAPGRTLAAAKEQKFFASFFQKGRPFSPGLNPRANPVADLQLLL